MRKLWENDGHGGYRRLYKDLTQEELLSLIEDARHHHWKNLDLQRCGLDKLPEELGDLLDLEELDISNNLGIKKGNENTFKTLPEAIGKLSNLQTLYLSGTQITTLPETIGNLSMLQTLDLNYSQSEILPESIGNLSNVQSLYLSGTQISSLPETICNLSSLQTLNLSRTQIIAFPMDFGESFKLCRLRLENRYVNWTERNGIQLDLNGTPLENKLPPEILQQSSREVIHYIQNLQPETANKHLNESKMVVVGQGSVGKSCVINQLLHDNETEKLSTEGIDIAKWKFKGEDGEKYTLNVWDFGGQKIYHATDQSFLTRRTLYLLVWDIRQEDEYGRMDYWLRTVQNLAGNSPIVIVVNKCDDELGRHKYIENSVLDRYPQIQRIFYVSCQDGTQIKELRKYIKDLAVKLPLTKTVWLNKWLSVRQELERLAEKENFIKYRQYVNLCASMGVDEEEAVSLAKYLHDLGIILYYHEDPLLKKLVILVPEWGTKAVYKILDEQQKVLKNRNGALKQSDLPKIWTDRKCYPSELYPYLLNLMENFQLAFKVHPEQNDTDYLVAELLDVNPVTAKWRKSGPEPLAFRYAYDFMPAGVMTRLIVALHKYLETSAEKRKEGKKLCWLKGAYLVYRSARAKITLYDGIDRKYIDIRIVGNVRRDRQHLLTVVRNKVNSVNSRFTKIVITELVPCKCPECQREKEPYFFLYEYLLKTESKGRETVECQKSAERVSILSLLDGVEPMVKQERRYESEDMPILPRKIVQTGMKKRFLAFARKVWKLFLDFVDYLENHPNFAKVLFALLLCILGYFSRPAIPTLLHVLFPDFFPAPSSEIVP